MGVGVGSFLLRFARFGRSQDTHNPHLEVATNLGVQGLVIFLGLIYVMLASLRDSSQAFRGQRGRLDACQEPGCVSQGSRKAAPT